MKLRGKWVVTFLVVGLAVGMLGGCSAMYHDPFDRFVPKWIFTAGEEDIPALIRELGSWELFVRWAAVRRLGELGPAAKDAAPKLVPFLASPYDYNELRMDAVDSLVSIGPAAVPSLIAALGDGNSRIRAGAAQVLGMIGPSAEAATPTVVKLMKDRNKDVRIMAAYATITTGGPVEDAARILAAAARGRTSWVIAACAARADAVIPVLLEDLQSSDPAVREAATLGLGWSGGSTKQIIPLLIDILLRDESPDVRAAAAEALGAGRTTTPEGVRVLASALKDENAKVRHSAAKTLGDVEVDITPAAAALIAAVGDENDDTRYHAVCALEKIRGKESIIALAKALKDPCRYVRSQAAYGLCEHSREDGREAEPALEALTEALADRDEWVRRNVIETLGNIGPPAVPALVKALKDRAKYNRQHAAKALGKLGPAAAQAAPALAKLIHDWDWYVRSTAIEALKKIQAAPATRAGTTTQPGAKQ